MMKQQQPYIYKALQQLKIRYNPANVQDIQQLQSVLLYKLKYPSTQLANFHMQANRLGKLDLRTSPQITEPKLSKSQSFDVLKNDQIQIERSPQVSQQQQTQIQCYCCGLVKQPKTLSLFTSFQEVKDLGISPKLFFISYQHNIALLLLMFFIYCLYAIISNVLSCNYDSTNLKDSLEAIPQYKKLISEWIFQVSLHANISCSTSNTAYQIQCWLGVVLVLVFVIGLSFLKYRKFKACLILLKKSLSIQSFTLMIQNLPINITKEQLERQLQTYQSNLTEQEKKQFPQSKSKIKIVKINRAAPMYLHKSLFQDKEIKSADKSYKNIKKKLISLIKSRRNKQMFQMEKMQRDKLYVEFDKQKLRRIQTYKRIVVEKINKTIKNKRQVVASPAFVTFQSNYNKQFLLKVHTFINKNFYYPPFTLTLPNNSNKNLDLDIKEAPKPQQIIWTNLGQKKISILRKKIVIFALTLIFLAGTCAGLYFLQEANFKYAVQNNKKNPSSTLALSLVVSIVIIVISYIISFILIILTLRQRNITAMHQQRSLSHKVFLSQIGNFIVVPLIFNFFFKTRFTGVVSLSETVFFLSLQNAFIFPVLKILDPVYLINRLNKKFSSRPTKKLELSQSQLNMKFQYLPFPVGFGFSYIIRSVLFTSFYAPLQPIIVVFTIIGMIIMYILEKYCLFNRCKRPIPGNRLVNIGINRYLMFGPILFGIGCLIWPYYINQEFIGLPACIIQIVLSFLIIFVPFQIFIDKLLIKYKIRLENRRYENWQRSSQVQQIFYSQNKDKFKFSYDRMNFMTAQQTLEKYLKRKDFTEAQNRKYMNHVNVRIPKSNIHNICNFTEELQGIGMKQIFEQPAHDVKIGKKNSNKFSDEVYENEHPSYHEHGFNDNQLLVNQVLEYIKKYFEINNRSPSPISEENVDSSNNIIKNSNNVKVETKNKLGIIEEQI